MTPASRSFGAAGDGTACRPSLSRRQLAGLPLLAAGFGIASRAQAQEVRAQEVREVRIAQQFGIAYLPLTIMREQRLLEGEAVRAGLPEPRVTWAQFNGGPTMNDALLSNSLDIASAGTPPVITLWARSRSNLKVRAIAALSGMPYLLVTNNPAVRTIRDFTERDRIAVPAVKVSFQSVVLQMAAEREWGPGQHDRLEAQTVTLPHPEAVAALLSRRTEITAHFANPPFQEQELAQPGLRSVLSSFDVLGPHSALLAYAAKRFYDANPRTVAAFVTALERANAFIKDQPREAAELYVRAERSALPADRIEALLRDPQTRFSTTPENVMKFADFQHRIGMIPEKPASWQELFFPAVAASPGS